MQSTELCRCITIFIRYPALSNFKRIIKICELYYKNHNSFLHPPLPSAITLNYQLEWSHFIPHECILRMNYCIQGALRHPIAGWQGYSIMHSIYHVGRVTSYLGKHIIVLLVCNEDTTRQQDLKWWASRFLGLKSSWMHLNNVMWHGELHVKLRVYHAWPSQCSAIRSS